MFEDKTALVTGASSGIGAAFARALAARGCRLVLVARSKDKLEAVAAALPVETEVLAADLSQPGVTLRPRSSVDILINNAGVGAYGRFEETPDPSAQIQLNCASLVRLTQAFLPPMLERKSGVIINVASTAAFQPVPYMAVYGATKAFVLSFSEALWAETRGRGVEVLALCPGATETEFFATAGEGAAVGSREKPERVVARALRAVEAGRSYVISGRKNYLLAHTSRLLPRATSARLTERVMRP
jgi:short-subunit dehydrogenase